mmetsp:Transcript_31128/g.70785  ORF Transcript_31128/g.70785 Transcript_31128/m.70785 type:complete len:206 (+) Transcript_31128:622-1239(+)
MTLNIEKAVAMNSRIVNSRMLPGRRRTGRDSMPPEERPLCPLMERCGLGSCGSRSSSATVMAKRPEITQATPSLVLTTMPMPPPRTPSPEAMPRIPCIPTRSVTDSSWERSAKIALVTSCCFANRLTGRAKIHMRVTVSAHAKFATEQTAPNMESQRPALRPTRSEARPTNREPMSPTADDADVSCPRHSASHPIWLIFSGMNGT